MRIIILVALVVLLISGLIQFQPVFAQDISGGVNKDGSWHVGEELKHGDYFHYKMCHVFYKECTDFEIKFWIEKDIKIGSESAWLVQTVVYDGSKVLKGTMNLGKAASPEPIGGSDNLVDYRAAFKSSIVWLSAFATIDEAKEFRAISWGKIGNIGGQQVKPTKLETVSTPAGTFETVLVTWYTGGKLSQVWVVDEFPFPVKASTWTHVSSGIPPQEYLFEILDHKENVQSDPFVDIIPTKIKVLDPKCPQNYDMVKVHKLTDNFDYLIDLKYGPEHPQIGCEIDWIINFQSKFSEREFLNQVQYDIFVVDDDLNQLRSIANEDDKLFLYSGSGQVKISTPVKEPVGTAHYVIWVYGLSPKDKSPSTVADYLIVDIDIEASVKTIKSEIIPPWIKNNAGWWAIGLINDQDFVEGIQYLINKGIIYIPPTVQTSFDTSKIPEWVKINAGWWSDGLITDNDFVQGIQHLIKIGIISIN